MGAEKSHVLETLIWVGRVFNRSKYLQLYVEWALNERNATLKDRPSQRGEILRIFDIFPHLPLESKFSILSRNESV